MRKLTLALAIPLVLLVGGCTGFRWPVGDDNEESVELPAQAAAQTESPSVVHRRVVRLNDAVTWAAQTAADAKAKADELEANAKAQGDTKTAQQASGVSNTAQQVGNVLGQVADATTPDPKTGQPDLSKAGGAIGSIWGPVGALVGTAVGSLLTGLIGGHRVGWRRRGQVWTPEDIEEGRTLGIVPAKAVQ